MRRSVKKGILKVLEVGIFLGVAVGSMVGFSNVAKEVRETEKMRNDMLTSDAVTEYIQEDLDKLDEIYDLSSMDVDEYKSYNTRVRILREEAAQQVYGEEYEKIVKYDAKSSCLCMLSVAGISSGLGLVAAELFSRNTIIGNVIDKFSDDSDEME